MEAQLSGHLHGEHTAEGDYRPRRSKVFHYDGEASDWDEFEWSRRAIHVSAPRKTKWWFAKRFLHPDVVAPYEGEYVFVWDEDLGVKNFDAEEYFRVVEKHGLQISQPALDPRSGDMTWMLTKRNPDMKVHKVVAAPYKKERSGGGWCKDQLLPPCAAFVEMMAPVLSREAWKCVWKLIQNHLVHNWGLDFNFHGWVGGGGMGTHERMGVRSLGAHAVGGQANRARARSCDGRVGKRRVGAHVGCDAG